MNELELAIYEAEMNGEIDSCTSDMMLDMISEGANMQAIKIKRKSLKQCKDAISRAKELYKKGDVSNADKAIKDAKKIIATAKKDTAALDWGMMSLLISPLFTDFVVGVGHAIVTLVTTMTRALTVLACYHANRPSRQNSRLGALSVSISNKKDKIIKYTRDIDNANESVKQITLFRGVVQQIRAKKAAGEPLTVGDFNVIKGGMMRLYGQYDQMLDRVQKQGHELAEKIKLKQAITKESVLEEIYEAELCGDITPEERMSLIDYMSY